jgi:glutaminase
LLSWERLADGGLNPLTRNVVDPIVCHYALPSWRGGTLRDVGRLAYDIGLPGKSGIGGGIYGVARQGWSGYLAPPLDSVGNSASRASSSQNSCRNNLIDLFRRGPKNNERVGSASASACM